MSTTEPRTERNVESVDTDENSPFGHNRLQRFHLGPTVHSVLSQLGSQKAKRLPCPRTAGEHSQFGYTRTTSVRAAIPPGLEVVSPYGALPAANSTCTCIGLPNTCSAATGASVWRVFGRNRQNRLSSFSVARLCRGRDGRPTHSSGATEPEKAVALPYGAWHTRKVRE